MQEYYCCQESFLVSANRKPVRVHQSGISFKDMLEKNGEVNSSLQ